MSKPNNGDDNISSFWKVIIAGAIIFTFLIVFYYGSYLTLQAPIGAGKDNIGITWYAQYGDAFGVITSFFTGLGTIGLIVTIALQDQTLKAQKKDLSLTREEMKGQKEELRKQEVAMTAQVRTMERQQVESTFFRLMDKHQSIVDSYNRDYPKNRNPAFKRMIDVTDHMIFSERCINHTDQGYETSYQFSILFCRSFYQVISYVDNSALSHIDKYSLVKLFRYDLEHVELLTIAANAIYVDKTGGKLKKIIEKYALLKNMSFIKEKLSSNFEDSAFGENADRLKRFILD